MSDSAVLTGVAFIVIGVAWFALSKSIARYQYRILVDVFRLPVREPDEQIQAMRRLGLGFAGLLLLAGLVLVTMELLWRR